MNIAMLLSLLVQAGACAPTQFEAPGGTKLTILVCPLAEPAKPDVPAVPSSPAEGERAL